MSEDKQFLDFKTYQHSGDEKKTLLLVYFSDKILNIKAEEMKMLVHVQNMYHTLPFILEAQNNFVRFNASQKFTLIMAIFNQEFDINVLVNAKVFGANEHFMVHTK